MIKGKPCLFTPSKCYQEADVFRSDKASVTTALTGGYGLSAGRKGQTCMGHVGGPHIISRSETAPPTHKPGVTNSITRGGQNPKHTITF